MYSIAHQMMEVKHFVIRKVIGPELKNVSEI